MADRQTFIPVGAHDVYASNTRLRATRLRCPGDSGRFIGPGESSRGAPTCCSTPS